VKIPGFDIDKYPKLVDRVANLNSYHQRLFLGVTALPLIGLSDYFFSPDKEKRNDSLSRTWAKIIAGTATGVVIRFLGYKGAIKLTNTKLTELKGNKILVERYGKKYESILFPQGKIGEFEGNIKEWSDNIENYRKALGTYLAIFTMCFTNFAIDMPLTNHLAQFLRNNVFTSEKDKINIFETPKIKKAFAFASNRVKPERILE